MIVTDEGADAKRSLGRLATDKCLRCGDKLVLDQFGEFNKYHCCSSCTDFIERERHKVLKAAEQGKCAHKDPNKLNLAFKPKCQIMTRMGVD